MTLTPTSPAPLAVVTGASTGIGRALAREFAQHGFDVVIAAEEPAVHDAAVELATPDHDVTPVQVDLSTGDGVRMLYDKIDRTPDAVALNVGVGVSGRFDETYAASEAFAHSFAEGIREELKDTGVTVTSLMPGPTDTEFFRRADMGDTPLGQSDKKDDAQDVAHDGYDALMAGKSRVVAGSAKNRIQAELGTHLPDALAAPLMARMTKPQD